MAKKRNNQNQKVAVDEQVTDQATNEFFGPEENHSVEQQNEVNEVNEVSIDKLRSDRAAEGKGKRMALVTGVKPEKVIGQPGSPGVIPANVLDGILGRHVAHAIEEVTIKAKTSPTKKDEARQFDAFYALDAEGMLLLSGGKMEPATPPPAGNEKDTRTDAEKAYGACDHFNYGRLLNVRQVERGRLEASIEGPEKQIAKLVKAMIDGGLSENESEAREEVITRLKKKGQLDPEYVWSGAEAATAAA